MAEAVEASYNRLVRRTKIVCTLGPASSTQSKIEELLAAGMNCARLNFSHGDHQTHANGARLVRKAASKAREPVAILADLQGPKMRVGRFAQGPVELVPGAPFALTTEDVEGDSSIVSVSHPSLEVDVEPGNMIALDDGFIRLRVERVDGKVVHTIVEDGGTLSDHKGLNLPGVSIRGPALTDKDREDLRFAIDELEVDYIALSFVRSPDDVKEAKALAGRVPVISKIERPEAVDALSEIIQASDGIMIARGDLGVELGAEKVPVV